MSDFKYILVQTKDLRLIPDYSNFCDSTLRRRMNQIRAHVGKAPRQPVTIFDLSDFLGIEESRLRQIMTINVQE